MHQSLLRLLSERARAFAGLGEHRLGELQIPTTEVLPEEMVEGSRCLVDAELGEALVRGGECRRESREDPAVVETRGSRSSASGVGLANEPIEVLEREASSVPDLVDEEAIALDPLEGES